MAMRLHRPGRRVVRRRGPSIHPPSPAGVAARARSAFEHAGLRPLPLAVRFWDGSELRGDQKPLATVTVRTPRAFAFLAHSPGQLGLVRAFVTGAIDVEGDAEAVLSLRPVLDSSPLGALARWRLSLAALRLAGASALRPPPLPASEARPRGRVHSPVRDRQAVTHHYDLSNRFYELLLGPSMSYSCAVFDVPDEPLESAQERKHELICQELGLEPGERLLDIGCGWGSLLLHAARRHRVRGVGVTLSAAQAELARARVREPGLSDRIEIRIADYRTLADGPYDKIASVGMYEHVGVAQYDTYARTVRRLLRRGGRFLNDGIARLFSGPRRGATFISRYVFPDGELHPLAALVASVERAGLEPRGLRSTREHYARTLRRWHANLAANRAAAEAEIGPEPTRVWEIYILGCALAFERGEITNYRLLAAG